MDQSSPALTLLLDGERPSDQRIELLEEEPLSIRVDGKPYAVVMRTPGDEIAHAAGFSLGEGIIESVADCSSIALCEGETANVVTVTLTPERRNAAGRVLQRRDYLSQTSCGICGKELVGDLFQLMDPLPPDTPLEIEAIWAGMEAMSARQLLHKKTRASHAATLCDEHRTPMVMAEDVGRHNALDKAIGKGLLRGVLAQVDLVVLSSRVSYELVQKSARAGVAVIFSASRPTRLAVELAIRLKMALACITAEKKILIFCGRERFRIHPS